MKEKDEDFEALSLEVLLSAYIDDELPEPMARQLRLLAVEDNRVRETLKRLQLGTAFGNRLFAQLLKEPLPISLARTIRQTEQRRA